jgi:hypothetical protein
MARERHDYFFVVTCEMMGIACQLVWWAERCPWHGWEFDIHTGQSWCDPSKLRVKTYPVSVEPGADLVKGPYVAETYPVTVEDDYVLVEV